MPQIPKYNIIFDRRGRASNGKKGAVEIEVTYLKERVRLATGVTLYKNQWNGGVVNHEDADKLNQKIKALLGVIQDKVASMTLKGNKLDIEKLKKAQKFQKAGDKEDFLIWLEERIENHPVKQSTRNQHLVMLECLKDFGKITKFTDLTVKNIKLWDDHIRKRVNTQTSVHGYHKRLKPYILEAIQLEKLESNPYDHFKVARGKSEGIKFLTEEERDAIDNLELFGMPEKVRDMFIFSCYTGLSYSDMVKITKKDIFKDGNNFCIRDKRKKTNTPYTIILLPRPLEILKKYNYNLNLMTNQKCNENLKLIANMANIHKNLTMHMGRHTFATWALKSGVDISTVSKMLAHSSVAMTEKYAQVLQMTVVKGYELLKNV